MQRGIQRSFMSVTSIRRGWCSLRLKWKTSYKMPQLSEIKKNIDFRYTGNLMDNKIVRSWGDKTLKLLMVLIKLPWPGRAWSIPLMMRKHQVIEPRSIEYRRSLPQGGYRDQPVLQLDQGVGDWSAPEKRGTKKSLAGTGADLDEWCTDWPFLYAHPGPFAAIHVYWKASHFICPK